MKKYAVYFFMLFLFKGSFSQTKKLLIIGIDGCRADVINKAFTPTMDSIIHLSNSAYSYTMKNETHTLSAANWSSMLTGVHWKKHHAKNNSKFKRGDFKTYPPFFKYLKDEIPSVKTASFTHWMEINKYIFNGYADEEPYLKEEPTDVAVKDKALEWLLSSVSPDAMFIHFDNVDQAGHATGFSPKNKKYTDAAMQVDEYVKLLYAAIKERRQKYKEDWLVIISTDHGGRPCPRIGGHGIGIFNKRIRHTFVIINGTDVQPGELTGAHTVDIAATALRFFNIVLKPEWQLDGKAIGLK